jgi:hypothetical protein
MDVSLNASRPLPGMPPMTAGGQQLRAVTAQLWRLTLLREDFAEMTGQDAFVRKHP